MQSEYRLLSPQQCRVVKCQYVIGALKLASKLGYGHKQMIFGVSTPLVHEENQPTDARQKGTKEQRPNWLEIIFVPVLYAASVGLGLWLAFHVFGMWRKWQYGWTPNDPSSATPGQQT
jgi:hypothetical protein